MKNQIAKFEKGNIYEMRFIGDSDLRPHFICTKRTAKMATFESLFTNEKFTKKIKIWDGSEYVLRGSYSMAPSIKASKIVG